MTWSAMSDRQNFGMPSERIAVVGATGAVGPVAIELLRERGYENVRAFATARSAGKRVGGIEVEEASPETFAAGEFDYCLFSIGTPGSRELVPHAVAGGATCIDKSSAFRLADGVPLVVPEVNGDRAPEHDGIVANPNCSTIPLVCVLRPIHDAVGVERVRVATYQAASGAGTEAMERLRVQTTEETDVSTDWEFDGEEYDEEAKLRDEARKILELPELRVSATCFRVPVLIGHTESIWIETDEPLSPEEARSLLARAPGVRLVDVPTSGQAAGIDDVLVGRIRPDRSAESGLAFVLSCDNLRKGAALNAIQIMELLLARRPVAAG
jgi:aspartate-semialdehyde dehydrogenase